MEIEQPLLNAGNNFQIDVWVNNKKTKLEIADNLVKIGSHTIKIADAIGLRLHAKKQNGSRVFRIYSFPKKKKFMRSQKRYLEYFEIEVTEPADQQKLQETLIPQINNRQPGQSTKLLICFNPNAGSNSRNHLNVILAFLAYTNLKFQVFETQYKNHCLQKLKELKENKIQDEYTAVAIVSGDGLVHQYVNSFSSIPLTHVPAGSGNAFAKTQMSCANQLCNDEQSIFLVIKNRKKKFNRVKFELENMERPIYSFLSFSWGIISDLDINSEFLRCLGGFRFEVYGAWRVIKMKRYRAKLTYSTIKEEMPNFETDLSQNPNYNTIDDTFIHTIFCLIPYISDKYKIAPLISLQQKFIDMQAILLEAGRKQLAKYLLTSDSGGHFDVLNQQQAPGFNFKYNKIKSFRLEPIHSDWMGVYSIDGEVYDVQKIQGSFCDQPFEAYT